MYWRWYVLEFGVAFFFSGALIIDALECNQCPGFENFLNGTLDGDTVKCSNVTAATCLDVQFCIKIAGKVSGLTGSNKSIDVLTYGCASKDLLTSFPPDGNSYLEVGDCQERSGTRLPANPAYPNTNLTFTGGYCLCHRRKCNSVGRFSSSILILFSALLFGCFGSFCAF